MLKKLRKEYRPRPVEEKTANLYAPLWEDFDKKLFNQSVKLFGKRLRLNGIHLDWFKGKICLDAGCGGGRYVVAMAKLGAKKVIGIDMNYRGLQDTQKRIRENKILNASLKHGSVLDIPYPKNSFDFVCCNGVLHHTIDPEKGLSELVRVLKPKGTLFLYVYGRGGLMWAYVDILRMIGKYIPVSLSKKFMTLVGIPVNNQFHWLDLMYVPIQKRYTKNEALESLQKKKLKNIRLLNEGRYPLNGLLGKLVYGEGELRFLASKR